MKVPKMSWPQRENYTPKISFDHLFHLCPKPITKPTPLDPKCYEKRDEYISEIKKANDNLQQVSKALEKVSKELSEAEKSLDTKWSKSSTKLSLVTRLKNDYTRASQQEDLAKSKIEEIEKKYMSYVKLVEIQERMEKNYETYIGL